VAVITNNFTPPMAGLTTDNIQLVTNNRKQELTNHKKMEGTKNLIRITDSLSEQLVVFKKSKKPLRLFVCGPTVYDNAHIGHARTYLVYDAFVKFLRSQKYAVSYIQNITDVDDRIVARAKEQKTTFATIAKTYQQAYHRAEKELNITACNAYPKASKHIKEIIAQIQILIKKGAAYETKHGVYFEVKKFLPYGKLSKQNLDALRPGWRIEPDPSKRDPLDFALWKKESQQPYWKSPWGTGRPGWHIEDTAITQKTFGAQYDIHGGASELKFPHHESEIAQQETASGKHPMVRAWMHTGVLFVAGQKMSKSLKNFITINDFVREQGPNVLRYMILSHHYRSPIDYTPLLVQSARAGFQTLTHALDKIRFAQEQKKTLIKKHIASSLITRWEKDFVAALSNDFNTPKAFAVLFECANTIHTHGTFLDKKTALRIEQFLEMSLKTLGFIVHKKQPIPVKIRKVAQKRELFRANKQFMQADVLRDAIHALGYDVDDTPQGPFVYKIRV